MDNVITASFVYQYYEIHCVVYYPPYRISLLDQYIFSNAFSGLTRLLQRSFGVYLLRLPFELRDEHFRAYKRCVFDIAFLGYCSRVELTNEFSDDLITDIFQFLSNAAPSITYRRSAIFWNRAFLPRLDHMRDSMRRLLR
jgi:hypothetical protein